MPGSDEQWTLHYRTLQDLFFIRSLPSISGEIGDFPNEHKQRESGKMRTKEYVPNKEQDKITARDLVKLIKVIYTS